MFIADGFSQMGVVNEDKLVATFNNDEYALCLFVQHFDKSVDLVISISSNDLPTKLVNIPIIFKSNRYMHPKSYKDVIMIAPRYSQHHVHTICDPLHRNED